MTIEMATGRRGGSLRAYLAGMTGAAVRVALVDSGGPRGVPRGPLERGVAVVDDDGQPLAAAAETGWEDGAGHGTACADLIWQIAPAASIVPIRIFGHRLETSPPALERGIREATARGVHVVSLSVGTQRRDALRSLYAACRDAVDAGVVLVATAPADRLSIPGAFDMVVGVDQGGVASPFDYAYRYGEASEIVAKGTGHRVPALGGATTRVVSGASFATSIVAGLCALILERRPGATVDEVRCTLAEHAVPEPTSASPAAGGDA